MSETLKTTNNEPHQSPRFPEDPNQYTEEELLQDPAKRFHVNPNDFRIFSKQAEMGENWGDPAKTLPLDETMGRFVKATADCIAVLAGEDDESPSSKRLPAADHIIYLDKSARPVCWFINTFWPSFTDKDRPNHSYLAIDRMQWFERTGTPIDSNGYVKDASGNSSHLAHFREDFHKENVSAEDIARIRALYIPGGIKNEDIKEIMATPTGLEGKNITIIDEVSHSGSTLDIAKYLVSLAIPEAASVNGYTYWKAGAQTSPKGESQMRSVPVWYNHSVKTGRGIGDVDEKYYADRYKNYSSLRNRALNFGAFVLGAYKRLSEEPGGTSRQLMREIQMMHKEWKDGHIIMPKPEHYNNQEWASRLKDQGVIFVPQQKDMPPNAYISIMEDITKRPAAS